MPPLPAEDPESMLRRAVLLTYPASIDAVVRLRQLESTGLFARVSLIAERPQPIRWAQANTDPFGSFNSDPHRRQWALAAIAAPGPAGAWHYTAGRSMVASLERGIVPGHPDVPIGPLDNFRLHSSTRIVNNDVLRPNELAVPLEMPDPLPPMPPHHGNHVNTIMAAPLNGDGIAGVCPNCTLHTFRPEGLFEFPLATTLAARFGTTALNISLEPIAIMSNPAIQFNTALGTLSDRDSILVASAGNDRVPRTNWFIGSNTPTVPHSLPQVLKIGATDADNHLWDEWRLVTLPITAIPPTQFSRRHPVLTAANLCTTFGVPGCIPWVIANRCPASGEGMQCGSSFGATGYPDVIDLVAPGVQVVAGMVTGTPSNPLSYSAVPPNSTTNPGAWAPSRTGLGVEPNGVAFNDQNPNRHSWGPMTGTSMAAPHVTATVGLMRSINPLLSAPEVREGLWFGANPNVPEYTRPRMGWGLLNARNSVELAAGRVRNEVLRNRLVPMFAMYAAQSQNPEESAENEVLSPPVPIHAWLYTTNPQLASAAMKTDIYVSNDPSFSPTTFAAYEHSHLLSLASLRKGIPISPSVYVLPTGAGKGFRNPAASFWVFTTPHSPLPGYTLQPLYRLTTDMTDEAAPQPLSCAGDQRKHLYSTVLADVLARTHPNLAHVCNAEPMAMRYHFESIEGYVYDRAGPQPPGTFPLFRVFNTNLGFNVAALVVQGESLPGYSSPGAADASNNPHFLGWVYRTFQPTQSGVGIEAADMDQDGLPNGVEIALGLNEQSANGDCEGPNDAVEYGFANLPDDPMSLTPNCVDGRVRVVRPNPNVAGEARVIFSNPAGPMAFPEGKALRVTFFQGGGWPTVIPPGCIYDDSEVGLSFKHYLCEIASALPASPGSMVEFVFQVEARTNPSPPPHQAVVRIPTGFTDPGIPSNNIATF